MKFYDRKLKLEILSKADKMKVKRSIMTVLIGRRKIGKTTFVLQHYSNDKVLYFFVSRKSENLNTPITLIIDEFQEFYRINESIFSSIQELWDKYKKIKVAFSSLWINLKPYEKDIRRR